VITDYKKLSDEDVVHRYVHRHEQEAFTTLYNRYAHLVLGVCCKYLENTEKAKDATQQIFIKLLEDLYRFDIKNFKAWLLQVVRNHCLTELRRPISITNNTVSLADDMDFEAEIMPIIEREKLLLLLEEIIETLPKEQKLCIELFYLQKKNYAEVATTTGYTMLQVKSYLQNGKRNLKNRLLTLKAVRI
jgi:RNA polymerase sigma-70 factor (ECF subfamily)